MWGKTGTGSAGTVREVYVSSCMELIRKWQIMAGFILPNPAI
jgi:hypothetical protein